MALPPNINGRLNQLNGQNRAQVNLNGGGLGGGRLMRGGRMPTGYLWSAAAWPLTVVPAFQAPEGVARLGEARLVKMLQDAAAAWEVDLYTVQGPASLLNVKTGVPPEWAAIVVLFSDRPAKPMDQKTRGTTAILTWDDATRSLTKVGIQLFLCGADARSHPSPELLTTVLQHELGHALGLADHNPSPHSALNRQLQGDELPQAITDEDRHALWTRYQWRRTTQPPTSPGQAAAPPNTTTNPPTPTGDRFTSLWW